MSMSDSDSSSSGGVEYKTFRQISRERLLHEMLRSTRVKDSKTTWKVERALNVAETLLRASPDDLRHSAGDLAITLVRIRCSNLTIEGVEESAEEKRQMALVALLVTCPFESLDILNKLLYLPNLDVSQRFLIIDVMTNAAQELADTKTVRVRTRTMDLISPLQGSSLGSFPAAEDHLG